MSRRALVFILVLGIVGIGHAIAGNAEIAWGCVVGQLVINALAPRRHSA